MDNKAPNIGEKVKFWEEQDKINNALIPRFLADHKQISIVSQEVVKLSAELSNSTIKHEEHEKQITEIKGNLLSSITQEVARVASEMEVTNSKYQELEKRIDEISNLISDLINKTIKQAESTRKYLLPYVVSGASVLLSIIAIIISSAH